MPTTKTRNMIYRALLPLKAPRLPRNPTLTVLGHSISGRDSYLRLLRRHRVLGASCVMATGQDSVLLLSSTEEPMHRAAEKTIYRVASITKMATALGILSLCEKGMLRLSDSLADFFPGAGLPRAAENMTLLRLLSHRAGLQDPPQLDTFLLSGTPFPEFLESCISDPPGDAFRYSNLGFGLLGCIMEKATGKTVSRVLEEEVFQPLEMQATLDASTLDPESIMPISRVLPYKPGQDIRITRLGSIPLTAPDPLRHYGHSAGSMYTDIRSLQRMLECLRDHGAPLIGKETGGEMSRIHAEYGQRSPTLFYGLGLLIIQDPSLSDSRILGHQGYAYGCADGAFWEENTGNMILFLNGGCSEERLGMLGRCNYDLLKLALRKELPLWHRKQK